MISLHRVLVIAIILVSFFLPRMGNADDEKLQKFRPDVVEKANTILEKAGLRRAGKVIQSTRTTEIARALSSLVRERRELKLTQEQWQKADNAVAANRDLMQSLDFRLSELNLQLARVAGVDVAANNRLVGLIEAARAQLRLAISNRDQLKKKRDEKRVVLNEEESKYTEKVLAIRKDYQTIHKHLSQKLDEEPVQIALKVMVANFQVSDQWDADKILASVDKRIEKIEQQIFQESIPLEVQSNGSLMLTVVVDGKPAKMVVDSGASLVTLPARTAIQLGINVPVDARELRLVMADGRTIKARAAVLPRVRVGEFEAENVEAAILDASASEAEALLGMSFLNHFKFEFDPAKKTITLLRIEP